MAAKTPDTHYTEPLEKTTFGKRYFVIDDAKHVWGADLEYAAAVQRREIVAGCGWSKTPTVREMPADPKMKAKIISLVRGPDELAPQVTPATHGTDADLERAIAALPTQATPSTNGSGESHGPPDDGDGDDDLSDLLDA